MSSIETLIKRYDKVFLYSLYIIETIEENAIEIGNTFAREPDCLFLITILKFKKEIVPFYISNTQMPSVGGQFRYSKKEGASILIPNYTKDIQAIMGLSKNFHNVSTIVHEIIHAFQKMQWKTMKPHRTRRMDEAEAAVFQIPIGLAIFMIRGNPMDIDEYNFFMHRLLHVQVSMPYFRMVEVRELLESNKQFIWEYAQNLKLKYSDFSPETGEYIGGQK